jgi:integrase/recombinase XerD
MSVGSDATEADNLRAAKEAELNARNAGVPFSTPTANGAVLLSAAIAEYLGETKLTKKPKTYAAYSTALGYFQENCHKLYVQEIQRKDLLKFIAFLRDTKEQSPRSVYNKFESVMTFLKAQKVRDLIGKNDWPRFTEEEPEIYEKEELNALFAASDPHERLWFEFFLMTGMREQEVTHTYWSDVDLNHAVVRVTHKPDRGWTPKAYREREIPIPEKLVRSLKLWKANRTDKACNLVFPTSGCKVKLDFLDCLKAIAERAELNKDDFWLHKFRSTFATWHLWAGVDLRTVQHWMGHKDLESTMRYLKPARGRAVRDRVNHTFVYNLQAESGGC